MNYWHSHHAHRYHELSNFIFPTDGFRNQCISLTVATQIINTSYYGHCIAIYISIHNLTHSLTVLLYLLQLYNTNMFQHLTSLRAMAISDSTTRIRSRVSSLSKMCICTSSLPSASAFISFRLFLNTSSRPRYCSCVS